MNEPIRLTRLLEPFTPKPLRPLLYKFQELIAYAVCGGLATIINGGVFYGLTLGFGVNYLFANLLAWFLSVVFAFLGNKSFVFEDADWSPRVLWKQAAQFFAARLFSLGLEEAILYVFVSRLGFDQNFVKIGGLAFVTISNYIFSKLLIFRKK